MTGPNVMGRSSRTIVELEQPRCINRFGTSPCTASGTPKCYQTGATCGDLENFTPTGSIKWRFTDGRSGILDISDFSDPDNPELTPIPCGINVSTSEGKLNAGSHLSGQSALGVTARVTVTLADFEWNDRVGDFYVANRSGYTSGRPAPMRGNFWALWTARNALFNGMYLRVYDGYEGQTLAEMRNRLYVVEKVDGPDANGKVTLTGYDPLRLADDDKAQFPPTSDIELLGGIDSVTTSITLFGSESDLTTELGTAGAGFYLSMGSELIKFKGYTDDGDGQYTLTGVTRGALGTVAEAHTDQTAAQRAGRFEAESFWRAAYYLLNTHTEMDSSFLPISDWNAEGDVYLPTFKTTHTVVEPTGVKQLVAQLSQQGLFYIWWAEYEQEIKMLTIRAPETAPVSFTDEKNIMAGAVLKRDPSARITKITVHFDQIDLFGGKGASNFRRSFTTIDGENLGETRAKEIFAPWITNRTQAVQLAVRLLIRYRAVPLFLSIQIDAKDRTATVGSVVDIETSAIIDSEGSAKSKRWQVISAKEMVAGESYLLDCQTYEFLGRFGRYMADGSPDYGSATEAQKEVGAFYADSDGELSDGSKGYLYQ